MPVDIGRIRRWLLLTAIPIWLLTAGTVQAQEQSEAQTKIVINIPARVLWLYQGDKIIKYYPVGVGRHGFPTPLGQYRIIRMVKNPIWEHPYKPSGRVRIGAGPNNPLGTRWLGFKQYKGGEYGIHGTDRPSSVGKFSSHGCVRMKVKDAEDLFNRVTMGTPVNVVYEPVVIRQSGPWLRAVVYRDAFGKGMPSLSQVHARILNDYPQAKININQLQAALKHPVERPQTIGMVETEAPVTQAAVPLPPLPTEQQ